MDPDDCHVDSIASRNFKNQRRTTISRIDFLAPPSTFPKVPLSLKSAHPISMSLADAAYSGALTLSQLRLAVEARPELLDEVGGIINLTPLCAACLGGHLRVVKHLLSCGANPNTPSGQSHSPLFYIVSQQCNASSSTRCAIIRELASGKHGMKADLDQPCDDDFNTALMLAISVLRDEEVVEQIMKCGASTTITFQTGQASAKDLLDRGIGPGDRSATGSAIDRAVSFLLSILAFLNYKTQDMIIQWLRNKQACLLGSQTPDKLDVSSFHTYVVVYSLWRIGSTNKR